MAKSSNRGGGTGTSDRGGVRSTLSAPWQQGSNPGSGSKMSAPFNDGSSGMPTTAYARGMRGPGGAPASGASENSSLGTIKTER